MITTTPTIDLGTIKTGSTTSFKFNVTNNSTNNVTLTTAATCGCIKPTLEKYNMSPFEIQTGTGTFKASSTPGAIKNKHITVTDNLNNSIIIKLLGNVI